MKQRDTQRSKVYAAERVAHQLENHGRGEYTCGCHERFTSLWRVEEFANDLYAHPVAIRLRHSMGGRYYPRIKVTDGRGSRSARGGYGTISMPRWSRCPMVIAHELTHNLVGVNYVHGRDFAQGFYRLMAVYDDMVGTELAVALGTEFDKRGVQW